MTQSPWRASGSLAKQEITSDLLNKKVYNVLHKKPPTYSFLVPDESSPRLPINIVKFTVEQAMKV